MATYARLQGGVVSELFTTDRDMTKLFPPGLIWLDVTATPQAAVGWTAHGGVAVAPTPPPADAAAVAPVSLAASLASVEAQLTALQAQLNQLAASTGGKS